MSRRIDFSRYFVPAKRTKTVWEKKVAVKFEVAHGVIVCRPMKRHAVSPVDSNDEPDWMVDFHGREEEHLPFISAAMVCSPVELAVTVGMLLAGFTKQTGIDLKTLLRGVGVGAEVAAKGFVSEAEKDGDEA